MTPGTFVNVRPSLGGWRTLYEHPARSTSTGRVYDNELCLVIAEEYSEQLVLSESGQLGWQLCNDFVVLVSGLLAARVVPLEQ